MIYLTTVNMEKSYPAKLTEPLCVSYLKKLTIWKIPFDSKVSEQTNFHIETQQSKTSQNRFLQG
jgi:hypothetical protein